jgi:hypothetical protein
MGIWLKKLFQVRPLGTAVADMTSLRKMKDKYVFALFTRQKAFLVPSDGDLGRFVH